MPLYQYKCEACNHIDEVWMGIKEDEPHQCSVCDKDTKRLLGSPSINLVGDGWAKDNYSKIKKSKD